MSISTTFSLATSVALFPLSLLVASRVWPSAVLESRRNRKGGIGFRVIILGGVVGALQVCLHLLATLAVWQVWPGIPVNAGSSLLYPFILAVILFVYIAGNHEVFRYVCCVVLLCNLLAVSATCLIRSNMLDFGLPSAWTEVWGKRASYMITFGTILLLFEAVMMVVGYRLLARRMDSVFLRILIILLGALMLDSAFFSIVISCFFKYEYWRVLWVQAVTKAVSGCIFASCLTWYMTGRDQRGTFQNLPTPPWPFLAKVISLPLREATLTCRSDAVISGECAPALDGAKMVDRKSPLSQTPMTKPVRVRNNQDWRVAQPGKQLKRHPAAPFQFKRGGKTLDDRSAQPADDIAARSARFRHLRAQNEDDARRETLRDLQCGDHDWRALLAILIEDLGFPAAEDRLNLAESLLGLAHELAEVPPGQRSDLTEAALAASLRKFGAVAPDEMADRLIDFIKKDESVCQDALVAVQILFSNAKNENLSSHDDLADAVFKNVIARFTRITRDGDRTDPREIGHLGVALRAAAAIDLDRLNDQFRMSANQLPEWQARFLCKMMGRTLDSMLRG